MGRRCRSALLDDKTFAKTPAQRLAVDPKLRVFRANRVTWTNGQLKHVSSGVGGVDVEKASAAIDEFDPDARDVFPGIYALGDCAHVLGGNYAPIAQVAERQGLVRVSAMLIACAVVHVAMHDHACHLCAVASGPTQHPARSRP